MELSPSITAAFQVAFFIEFCLEVCLSVGSIFVAKCVLRCAVIHGNLKVFLLVKCSFSCLFGLIRCSNIAQQLCKGEFDTLSPVTLAFLTGVCVGTNNYLCAAYAIERLLATVFVKRYEMWRPYLGVISSVAIVSVNVYNAGSDTLWRPVDAPYNATYSVMTIVANYSINVVGILSLAVVCALLKYNLRMYEKRLLSGSISQFQGRYQNSENVRTTRQLLPVILLHVTSGIVTNVYITSASMTAAAEHRFFERAAHNFIVCILYNLCLVMILHSHPSLRRKAASVTARLFSCLLRHKTTVHPTSSWEGVTGSRVRTDPARQDHYESLARFWDAQYESKNRRETA